MPTTEKEIRVSEHLYKEIENLKNSLSQTGNSSPWLYSFVQHPSNFPIVNYERVFFWHLESVAVSKALFELIYGNQPESGNPHFDIKYPGGYLCLYH